MGYVTPRALGAFTADQIAQEARDAWNNIHDVQYPAAAGWVWREMPGTGGLLIQAYNTKSGVVGDALHYKPDPDLTEAELLASTVAAFTTAGTPEAIDTLADFHDHASGDPRLTDTAQAAISILQSAGATDAAANAQATQSHAVVLDDHGQWTPGSTSRDYFPPPAPIANNTIPTRLPAVATPAGSPVLPGVKIIDIAAPAPVLLDDGGASARSSTLWKAIGIAAGIGALVAIANHHGTGRR